MNFLYIVLGILFLVDPVFGLHDYLPDFIGCLLICYGIKDVSFMIEKLAASKRWFTYAAAVSALRFAVSFTGAEKINTLPLTLSFSFAVVEIIIYIPAIKNFFSGFEYAAMRYGGSGMLSLGRKKGIYTDEHGERQYGEIQKDSTGTVATFSQVFIVLRALISILPELPSLQLQNVGDVDAFQFSSVGNLIRLVCAVIVLIPGIILLCLYIRLYLRLRKLDDFTSAIDAELARRFGNMIEMRTCSMMKVGSFAAGGAMLLYMGFYDYQVNVLPRYLTAVLVTVFLAMLFAGMEKGERKWVCALPLVLSAITVPLSRFTYSLQSDYYALYRRQMMQQYDSGAEFVYDIHINRIRPGYLKMAAVECAEAVICGLAVIAVLVLYKKVVLRHAETFGALSERSRAETLSALRLRGVFMIVGASLSTAYFTAYRFILPFFDYAPAVGIAVNIFAASMVAVFAVYANREVYGNVY